MLNLIISKEKVYPFSKKGLEMIEIDKIKYKINLIGDGLFYSVVIILLILGIIGSKFLINYVACTGTSKFVKWLMSNR